jgi:hypothetical protein
MSIIVLAHFDRRPHAMSEKEISNQTVDLVLRMCVRSRQ